MAKKRVDMSSLFGDDAGFNQVEKSGDEVKEEKAVPVVSAAAAVEKEKDEVAKVIPAAVPAAKKMPAVIMASHKTINTEKKVDDKGEKAKVTFTPDAILWEEVLLLAEKQGMKQIEFLTSVLKKEVDANRPVVDKMKALKKQMQNL